MEVVRTSETLVNFNVTTQRYSPEDSKLHPRRRENLKSHILNPYLETTLIALIMEAVRTSETLVNFNVTTQRYSPEDSKLQLCNSPSRFLTHSVITFKWKKVFLRA
jgi:hypothetical protein